jgi:hypothetical protein
MRRFVEWGRYSKFHGAGSPCQATLQASKLFCTGDGRESPRTAFHWACCRYAKLTAERQQSTTINPQQHVTPSGSHEAQLCFPEFWSLAQMIYKNRNNFQTSPLPAKERRKSGSSRRLWAAVNSPLPRQKRSDGRQRADPKERHVKSGMVVEPRRNSNVGNRSNQEYERSSSI